MYPTTAELVALADEPALSGASSTTQDRWRTLAIRGLEAHARQSFTVWEGSLSASGMGGPNLYLPRRLLALTGIKGAGGVSPLGVTVSPERDRITLPEGGGNYATRVLRDFDGQRPFWPRGDGNVVLTGRWGWESLPDGVAEVLAEDMAEQARSSDAPLGASVDQFRALGISSISQGNLAISLAHRPSGLSVTAAILLPPDLIWSGDAGIGTVV